MRFWIVDGQSDWPFMTLGNGNATENTVFFAIVAFIFRLISPPVIAAQIWIVGFAVARLGHTYGYLKGSDSVRSVFMSLSLVAMFGILSYLAISTFV